VKIADMHWQRLQAGSAACWSSTATGNFGGAYQQAADVEVLAMRDVAVRVTRALLEGP